MRTTDGITTILPEDLESEARQAIEREKKSRNLTGRVHSIRWYLRYGKHLTLIVVGKVNPNHFLETSVTL